LKESYSGTDDYRRKYRETDVVPLRARREASA
jgi:hypothetical protein